MVCLIRNLVLLVSVIRRVRCISNLHAISTNLVSSSCMRRRAWYIDQDDRSCDYRCQKVAKKIGVCVPPTFSWWRSCSGKQTCIDAWETDWDLSISNFSVHMMKKRANAEPLKSFLIFSSWGVTRCAAFTHFFTKNPLLSSHAFWTKKYLGP